MLNYVLLVYSLLVAIVTYWFIEIFRSYRQFKASADSLYRSAPEHRRP